MIIESDRERDDWRVRRREDGGGGMLKGKAGAEKYAETQQIYL